MGPMATLDSWTRDLHEGDDGTTRPIYTRGSGPGVIVIHELPGMTPDVVAFGEDVVAAGFTVVMPVLFGNPGTPMSFPALTRSLIRDDKATGTRFQTLEALLGDNFAGVEFAGKGHATLTAHRQQEAVDRVLAFFGERLRA